MGRSLQLGLLLAVVVVVLLACGQASREPPPCAPLDGATIDPCAGDLNELKGNVHNSFIIPELWDPEPWTVRDFLEGETDNFDAHLVVRGHYLPGTVRCAYHQGYRPKRVPTETYNTFVLSCYADIQVASYIVGSGPSTLTAQVGFNRMRRADLIAVYGSEDVGRTAAERGLTEGFRTWHFREVPSRGITGVEAILFLGPALDSSVETWAVHKVWDLERQDDGSVIAVHPYRFYWETRPEYETTNRAKVELPVASFVQKTATAHTARVDDYDGRISEDQDAPMLVTDATQLHSFYVEIGAVEHPSGPPVLPPPVLQR